MQFLLGQCHIAFTDHQGVLLTLLIAGLVGGLTHCSGMCGPFVLAQIQHIDPGQSKLSRYAKLSLLPYHLGRMTTYVFLGMLAAVLSKQIIGTPLQQGASVAFLSIAGAMFIFSALPRIQRQKTLGRYINMDAIYNHKFIHAIIKPLFASPKGSRGYGLGILLGFLPCSLIFAALMVVSTVGNPFVAAMGMILFTFGTFPSLFLVGVGGHIALRQWPNAMHIAARGVMVFNGCGLLVLAGNLVL